MDEEIKEKRPKSPFKDKDELRKEITDFINIYKVSVANHADRMSDYFEMLCYNYIVRFYELSGYTVEVDNLQSNKYRYKCSPSGIQSNFSNFKIRKSLNGAEHIYEVHHNLSIESAHTSGIYTTPDITIIRMGGVNYSTEVYETKIRFSYVKQTHLLSFCEVKQFNPFPELLFNFIGTINELYPSIMTNATKDATPEHIAPCLMISGVGNKHTRAIKKSIESRYCLNIIYEMFYTATSTFSKKRLHEIRRVGKLPPAAVKKKKGSVEEYMELFLHSKEDESE